MKHEVKMTWEEDENDTPTPDPRGEWLAFLYEGDKLGRHVCMLGMIKRSPCSWKLQKENPKYTAALSKLIKKKLPTQAYNY